MPAAAPTVKVGPMRMVPARVTSPTWMERRRANGVSALLALRLANLASGSGPLVADALLQQLRRTSPLLRALVPSSTATARRLLRRELARAVAEYEAERRKERRRRLRLTLAFGALAAAAVGGSSRLRGAA
jgi:hypothetical protein